MVLIIGKCILEVLIISDVMNMIRSDICFWVRSLFKVE